MPKLDNKLRFADASPMSGRRESYRFWKRQLRDAGKQRCWSTIAPRLQRKVSRWRPTSWNEQIPVDADAIKNAQRQLLQWLSLPEPNCTEKLIILDILDKNPGMFPFRRTIDVVLVQGLFNGMNSKSSFEKPLMYFIDCLSEPDRRTFLHELTSPNLDTGNVG